MKKAIILLGLCLFLVSAALADSNPLPPGQWLPFHGEDFSVWQSNVKKDPAFPFSRKDLNRTLKKLAEDCRNNGSVSSAVDAAVPSSGLRCDYSGRRQKVGTVNLLHAVKLTFGTQDLPFFK